MAPLRVVLYAEGAGETAGTTTQLPIAPGSPLREEHLGAAHVLVRRVSAEARGCDPGEIRFEAPLRRRGRLPRGSDLVHPPTLRQLLSWARPALQPDVAIVLVDADGDRQRRTRLGREVGALLLPRVIAAAVQEFETWLAADDACCNQVIGSAPCAGRNLEKMKPREARTLLAAVIGGREASALRRRLAAECDLAVLAKRCKSFDRLMSDLEGLSV
jgi:hypothetical protein